MKVYSLSSQAKLNTVPNILVMNCEIDCYDRICEGCESKKSKIAVCARICARVKEPSHRAKRGKEIRMREKGKSARAVGDKNVRPISKSVGEKKKNVGDFPKNVGENLEKLRRFLSNLRSLVVMLAGCAWCVGQRIETEPYCPMGPRYSGKLDFRLRSRHQSRIRCAPSLPRMSKAVYCSVLASPKKMNQSTPLIVRERGNSKGTKAKR